MDPDPGSIWLFTLLIALLALCCIVLSWKLYKLSLAAKKDSLKDLRAFVDAGFDYQDIDRVKQERINSIVKFDNKTAEEIMVPRTDVFAVDIEEPIASYLDELLDARHTRIPVYQGEIDNLVGILYMKDFIVAARAVGFENISLSEIVKPAYFVPETKNIDELLREMQSGKRQMALLIDEYGGFSGIVTIEDLMEEILGDIHDETDPEETPEIVIEPDGSALVCGWAQIEDVNKALDLQLNEDEDYDTVGGLVLNLLGVVPEDGQTPSVSFGKLRFDVLEVRDMRIERLRIVSENTDADTAKEQ